MNKTLIAALAASVVTAYTVTTAHAVVRHPQVINQLTEDTPLEDQLTQIRIEQHLAHDPVAAQMTWTGETEVYENGLKCATFINYTGDVIKFTDGKVKPGGTYKICNNGAVAF